MATFTATPANWTNASSDANFRAWGLYVSTQLAAVGHIQTADTGQINWTTVSNPGATNTYAGYEIWRFADALQATAPVFIKIEYGESATIDAPSMRIQFGSGSDGAGALTGNLSSQYLFTCAPVAGACVVHGSGSTNRFVMCAGYTAAGGFGMWGGWERSRDANGDVTAEAVLFMSNGLGSASSTSVNAKQVVVWSTTLGTLTASLTVAPAIFPLGATATTGAQTIVAPVLFNKGVFMNPGLNFVGYFTENISPTGTPSVYMYGASHTYYALPATSAISAGGWQGPGAGTEALAILYE